MDDELDANALTDEDLAREEERIFAKYNEPFQPREYRPAFYLPQSDGWYVDALYPDGYYGAAKVVLEGIATGSLSGSIEGVAAVFLVRHYLELAIKYVLFHSRWLKDERHNATEIDPVGKGHPLLVLWGRLTEELRERLSSVLAVGFDLDFVGELVKELDGVDRSGTRFRYPGEQLPVIRRSHNSLRIDFDVLLSNLKRVHDVLDTLDGYLIETHGQNEDWEDELKDLV